MTTMSDKLDDIFEALEHLGNKEGTEVQCDKAQALFMILFEDCADITAQRKFLKLSMSGKNLL